MMIATVAWGEKAPVVQDDRGFEHFYNLEYDEALAIFSAEAERSPSPDAFNHIAQTILFRELYRSGALESGVLTSSNGFLKMPKLKMEAADQERFTSSIAKAMEMAEARIAQNKSDTGALYALGVSYGLRGNYNLVAKKAYIDALRDATNARKTHNHVTEMDPEFIDARFTQGLHDYIVGSLPIGWKMLGFMAGHRGDRGRGIRTLELVAEQGHANKLDAAVLLSAIYRRERRQREAIALLDGLIAKMPRNHLLRFERAEMLADLGDRPKALAEINEIERLKVSGAAGFAELPEDKIRKSRERAQTNVPFRG
jgi:tetratricopeptide (TPR) repeat protein